MTNKTLIFSATYNEAKNIEEFLNLIFGLNIDFDILACETVGWVFPNRMPEFILPLAKKLPFNLPIIGLSNVIICKRRK